MLPNLFILIVLLQYASSQSTSRTPKMEPRAGPLVNSKVGLIKGLRASDGDYAMFLGIPYANVDKNNIFGDAAPYPKFSETFEAFDDSAICPQIEEFNKTTVGTLDCLHLNLFVPTSASANSHLPVLVWIHGGGFQFGSYNRYVYGPKFLVRHNIVLVTLNYRLGPYGFMCTKIPEVSGNQGLKDQQKGLKWVKENIEAFGGDADKITIFGESAGAASVDFHIINSEEKLFHQAILQSGVTLSPWVTLNPGAEGPLKLAKHLGFVTEDIKGAISFLASIDTNRLIAATNELNLFFSVCVEKDFENVDNFVTDYPVNIRSVPNIKNIPLLIGFNSDEDLSRYINVDDDYLEYSDIIRRVVNETFDMDQKAFDEMSEVLRNFYFGDKDVNNNIRRAVIDLSSDFSYAQPTQMSLKKYLNNSAKTIFSYMFSYVGKRNLDRYTNGITTGGASHTDEIGYLFDVSYMKSVMFDEEQIMVDRITTLWTNFVKYGDPTPKTTDLLPVKWSPVTKGRWNYLNINSKLALENRPFSQRMAFLDLFFKVNKKYLIGYNEHDDNGILS